MKGLINIKCRLNKPFMPRKLELCNDVELNPGPKSPTKVKNACKLINIKNKTNDIKLDTTKAEIIKVTANDVPRVKKLGMYYIYTGAKV